MDDGHEVMNNAHLVRLAVSNGRHWGAKGRRQSLISVISNAADLRFMGASSLAPSVLHWARA